MASATSAIPHRYKKGDQAYVRADSKYLRYEPALNRARINHNPGVVTDVRAKLGGNDTILVAFDVRIYQFEALDLEYVANEAVTNSQDDRLLLDLYLFLTTAPEDLPPEFDADHMLWNLEKNLSDKGIIVTYNTALKTERE